MAITDHTRKILWGRSGNRCAICKRQLVVPGISPDPEAVIGDECHIVAQASSGPRAGQLQPDQLDQYPNLILLCKVDHKRVDDQPASFTAEGLRTIKANHEQGVENTLEIPVSADANRGQSTLVRVERIGTGKDLITLVASCGAYQIDHAEPENEEEAELVAEISGEVQDWADIYDDVNAAERVRAGFRLTSLIRALETHGLTVWGGTYRGQITGGGRPVHVLISVVAIRRN